MYGNPQWNPGNTGATGVNGSNAVGEKAIELLYGEAAPYLEQRKAALEQILILRDFNERHHMGVTALQAEALRVDSHIKALEPAVTTVRNFRQAAADVTKRSNQGSSSGSASTSPIDPSQKKTLFDGSSPSTGYGVGSASPFHTIALQFENPLYADVLQLRAQIFAEEDTLALLLDHYCTLQDGSKASTSTPTPDSMIALLVRDAQEVGRRIFAYQFMLHRLLRRLQLPISSSPGKDALAPSGLPPSSSTGIASTATTLSSSSFPPRPSHPPSKKLSALVGVLTATSVSPPSSSGKQHSNASSSRPSITASSCGIIQAPTSRLSPKSALKIQFPQASDKLIDKVLKSCGNDPIAAKKRLQSLSS